MIRPLQSSDAAHRRDDETERTIQEEGQELCRLLFQAALDVRSNNEETSGSRAGS